MGVVLDVLPAATEVGILTQTQDFEQNGSTEFRHRLAAPVLPLLLQTAVAVIGSMDQFVAMATFVRVVETGSLSAAARSLPSSLTSVSRQISALEELFGTRLLTRTTRRLALTDDGRLLYDRAKSILAELKEVELALSSGRQQPSGRLRISAPSLLGRLLIAPLLAEFLRRHPSVSVELLLLDAGAQRVPQRLGPLARGDDDGEARGAHLPISWFRGVSGPV